MSGERVSIMPYLEGLFDDFDGMFANIVKAAEPVSRLPTNIVSSSFPPADIYEEDSGELVLELAVAGYSEKDISIKFEDNHLNLQLEAFVSPEGRKYIQKGIKGCKYQTKYYIPVSKYEVGKAEAKIKDGILSVRIPVREESKPRVMTIKVEK